MITRVLADANALYSRTVRDWLILLQLRSGGGMFRTYWTEDIMAELCYHLRKNNPACDGAVITRVRDRIVDSLEGGRVDSFTIDGSFPGTDPDDQHVHAAAIACKAHIVVTIDNGFTAPGVADELPYEVYEPDDLFVLIDDSFPDLVLAVAHEQVAYWRTRGSDVAGVVERLRKAGCPEFATRVAVHLS